MRCVNSYLKVQGHESLVRDMDSKAIVATDDLEYKNYMLKREAAISSANLVKKNKEDIDELKVELKEIKSMLMALIKDR